MVSISRRVLFGKLGIVPFKALESAAAFAKLRGNPYIEVVHWLHQLWQLSSSDLHCVVTHWKLDAAQLEKELIHALSRLPDGASHLSDFSAHIELAVERGWIFASLNMADQRVRSAWLLFAMLEHTELRRVLLNISVQFQRIVLPVDIGELTAALQHSCENADLAQDSSGLPAATSGEASQALTEQKPGEQSALARRFQVSQVMEPELSKVISMVRGLVPVFMHHHQVEILDEAVRAAVTLSHRYIPSRHLSDQAISLLDTACARVAMSLHTPPSDIVHLRQRQQVLMAEYAQHLREAQLGQSNAASMQQVTRALSETDAILRERESHWKSELALVQRLQQTQESLFKENSHQDDSFYSSSENEKWQTDTDLTESQQVNRKQLAVIQDELLSMQGDNTCVPAQVDEAVIAAIVAEWTGIPLSQMMRDEVSAVMELAERLKKRVVE